VLLDVVVMQVDNEDLAGTSTLTYTGCDCMLDDFFSFHKSEKGRLPHLCVMLAWFEISLLEIYIGCF
jgi:hypothetical protein